MISRTVTSPLERAKVVKQVNIYNSADLSTMQTLRVLYKHEGWPSFFRGNGALLLGAVPWTGLQFFFYNYFKFRFEPEHGHNQLTLFACASLTAIFAGLLCPPTDPIKTVLSTNVSEKNEGIIGAAKRIYAMHGIRGFYRGLTMSIIGGIPYVGINLSMFDYLKNHHFLTALVPNEKLRNTVNGALSGFVALTVVYPVDVFRKKYQVAHV